MKRMMFRIVAARMMFVGALLALFAPARGVAQITWTNRSSPVLGPGPGWESSWVGFVSVIYENSQYVMWYSGAENLNGVASVGRATSPDGQVWTKDTLNPVMGHGSSAWDAKAAWIPKVLKIGNSYTMWFTGSNSSDLWQIGRATSTNGRVWVQDTTNPVIRVGASGQWDAALVHTGSVLFDGTTYRMWYTGMSQGYGKGSAGIGLATSADGIHWVKDTLDNPVLSAGSAGAWDHDGVGECSVVYDSANPHYLMFYDGNEVDYFQAGTSGIGYASSLDGIHWVKSAGNPVLANNLPGSWNTVVNAPFVLLRDSTFHMWYGGSGTYMGYATSPRVLTGVAEYGDAPAARDFHLQQNYPNPFNPTTTIRYAVPQRSLVTLTVFNMLGQQVATLVNGDVEAGYHEVRFDAAGLASGAYFYRMQAGSYVDTKELLLIR
jgi:predicted GH43/DUF377 family glycosyl hydrolase